MASFGRKPERREIRMNMTAKKESCFTTSRPALGDHFVTDLKNASLFPNFMGHFTFLVLFWSNSRRYYRLNVINFVTFVDKRNNL